jgi:hypothetical protein
MTTPAGPQCDLCGEEAAVESVMNLADYSQIVIGPACLPAFHEGMAAQLRAATGAPGPAEGALAAGAIITALVQAGSRYTEALRLGESGDGTPMGELANAWDDACQAAGAPPAADRAAVPPGQTAPATSPAGGEGAPPGPGQETPPNGGERNETPAGDSERPRTRGRRAAAK